MMQFTIGKETLYLRFIKDDTFSLFSFFGSFPSFFVGNIIFRWSPLASHAACCLHQDKKLTFCCKINHSFSNFLFISAPLSLSFSLSLWYPFPYCVSLLSFFMRMSLYFFSVFFFILYHTVFLSRSVVVPNFWFFQLSTFGQTKFVVQRSGKKLKA